MNKQIYFLVFCFLGFLGIVGVAAFTSTTKVEYPKGVNIKASIQVQDITYGEGTSKNAIIIFGDITDSKSLVWINAAKRVVDENKSKLVMALRPMPTLPQARNFDLGFQYLYAANLQGKYWEVLSSLSDVSQWKDADPPYEIMDNLTRDKVGDFVQFKNDIASEQARGYLEYMSNLGRAEKIEDSPRVYIRGFGIKLKDVDESGAYDIIVGALGTKR